MSLYHGGCHVAVGKLLGAHHLFGYFLAVVRGGAHRHQIIHLVAAVNVKHLADWSQAVCGVDVAAVLLVEIQTPVTLIFMPVRLEIVYVGAFAVNHLAEQALFGHVESCHLEKVVGAVFEHHAVTAGLFRHIDQLPTILNGCSRRHFHGHVFAVLHGINSHGHMSLPVGADVHQVDIVTLTELLIGCLAYIFSCTGQAFGFQYFFLDLLHILRKQVAQGHNLHAVYKCHAVNSVRAAHAQTYETYAHHRHRLCCKLQHGGLTGNTLRLVKDNDIIFNLIIFSVFAVAFATAHSDDRQSQH